VAKLRLLEFAEGEKVRDLRFSGVDIYAQSDPNAIFEGWATLTVRVGRNEWIWQVKMV